MSLDYCLRCAGLRTFRHDDDCTTRQDDDQTYCIVCEDKGYVVVHGSDLRLPCPGCDTGWNE